jgi:AcrR family transcriptional regulator
VVRTATELFIRRGYVATTLTAIAADAGVAVQTIYSTYSSKVGVLRAAHDMALAGDDEPIPLTDRAWFKELATSPTAHHAWHSAVTEMHVRTARVAPLYRVMLAAEADADVAALMETLRSQRATFSHLLVDQILTRPGAEHTDRERLAAVIYAIESVETYTLFVIEAGWSLQQWREWVDTTVERELLPPQL